MKHSARPVVPVPVTVAVFEPASPLVAVVAELTGLQAQLGELGDQLAGDAFVLVNHPQVQLLDAAGQRIGRIIKALQTAVTG